jgi:hypothetical protein
VIRKTLRTQGARGLPGPSEAHAPLAAGAQGEDAGHQHGQSRPREPFVSGAVQFTAIDDTPAAATTPVGAPDAPD